MITGNARNERYPETFDLADIRYALQRLATEGAILGDGVNGMAAIVGRIDKNQDRMRDELHRQHEAWPTL